MDEPLHGLANLSDSTLKAAIALIEVAARMSSDEAYIRSIMKRLHALRMELHRRGVASYEIPGEER